MEDVITPDDLIEGVDSLYFDIRQLDAASTPYELWLAASSLSRTAEILAGRAYEFKSLPDNEMVPLEIADGELKFN